MPYLLSSIDGNYELAKLMKLSLPPGASKSVVYHTHDAFDPTNDAFDPKLSDKVGASARAVLERHNSKKGLKRVEESPRNFVYLPPEIVHKVLDSIEHGQQEPLADYARTLRNASLVCKLWTDPARRVRPLKLANGSESIRRLCSVFDRHPELGRAVKKMTMTIDWTHQVPREINKTFKRLAALLRMTPVVTELSLPHYPLSQKTRNRFVAALRTLGPSRAHFTRETITEHRQPPLVNPREDSLPNEDIRALGRLLVDWTSLKSLSLFYYERGPPSINDGMFPPNTRPQYHLDNLTLSHLDLPGRTLFSLLGSDFRSLTSLELDTVSGLTKPVIEEALKLLGPTLARLHLASDYPLDVEDAYEAEILVPLVNLTHFCLSNEDIFRGTVLDIIIALPRIDTIAIYSSSLSYRTASAALDKASSTVESLSVDTDVVWNSEESWAILSACEAKNISLTLNGETKADIEQGWWGHDFSESWSVLEK